LTRLEADIALRFARPSSGDLIAKRLMSMPLNVVMSHTYLREHGMPSLQHGRWVNVTLPHFTTPEAQWYETYVTVEPWLHTNSYVLATEAITSGRCVGLTTAIVERMPKYELLSMELHVPLPQPLGLWLVTHQSLRHVPRIDAVWSWLEEVMATHTR
jgi:DNA-binding transcriptional LysR family regulator